MAESMSTDEIRSIMKNNVIIDIEEDTSEPAETSNWKKLKDAFKSKEGLKSLVYLKNSTVLANNDLLPVPPDKKTWEWYNFFAYWFSESWAVSTWSLGSSMVAGGMTVKASILVFFFANLLLAFVIILNSRAASMYGIGFSILSRVTFGIYGSYFQIILRSILGIIWGGVQLYFEGQFISIMFRCIFTSWWKLPNHIPANQYIDTKTMVAFFLAFLVTIPFMLLPSYQLKHIFSIKCITTPLAGIGIVIWTCTKNGGVSTDLLVVPQSSSTTTFAFFVLAQCNSLWGASSALLVTSPDLSRFSKNGSAPIYGNILALPIAQLICGCFGILSTAAVFEMWGESYWNPYDLFNAILDHHYNSKARAGVFFASFCFFFATLGTSIACNIMPFAMDVTCLAPKFINTIRGQFMCLIIAFAIVPWRIVSTSNGFLTFLSGYSIFQGSVVASMIVDYWFRRGNIIVKDCFSSSKKGRYYFVYGVNLRSYFAFIAGFVVPLPGFIGSFGHNISVHATRIFNMGWLISLAIGGLIQIIMCLIFPYKDVDKTAPFESYANNQPTGLVETSTVLEDIETAESFENKALG